VTNIPSDWTIHSSSKPFINVRAHCLATIDGTTKQQNGNVSQWQNARDFRDELLALANSADDSSEIDPQSLPVRYKWLFDRSYARPLSSRDQSEKHSSLHEKSTKLDWSEVQQICKELAALGNDEYIFRAGFLPATTSNDIEEGDTVWAVDGCTVPLILRNASVVTLEDVNGQSYEIVGTCYLLAMSHLDCWVTSGTGLEQRWDFDPFRHMDALSTQMIRIY
jgi:hypothetical protein